MKFNPVIKNEQIPLFRNCMVCGKNITDGYYGRWGTGGTCSKVCEEEQEKRKETECLAPDGSEC